MEEPWVAVLGYVLGALGVTSAGVFGFIANKGRNKLESRRDTVADRDGLIESFQESVTSLRTDVRDLRQEVKEVRDHNRVLVEQNAALLNSNSALLSSNSALLAFGYQTIGVLRENDLASQIPNPVPAEIHL